jgi:hypothetical protein
MVGFWTNCKVQIHIFCHLFSPNILAQRCEALLIH